MSSDSLGVKVRQGLLWSLISSWGNRLLMLIFFMLFARVLNQHDLGVFAAALVVFNFLALFVDQGLGESIVQRAEVSERQLNAVFAINLALAILVFGLLWVIAPWLANRMSMPELLNILRVGSVSILIGALCFSQQAMHRRNFNYRWLAICLFAATIISGGAAIFCALQGYGVWALVVQTLVASVVTAIMLWIKPQWHLSLEFDFKGVRGMFSYGLNRLGTNVLDFAYSRYIEIFLVAVLGPVALGIYSVGVRVYQAMMQALSGAILDVAHNGFSRLAQDRERLHIAYYQAVSVSAALALPMFLWLGCMAHELILVLFGQKWEQSVGVMQAMAWLGAVQVMQFYNGTLFNAVGRPSLVLAQVVLKAVVTFIMLWLYRHESMMTIVHVYVLAQLVITPISFYLLAKIIGISLSKLLSKIWLYLVASGFSCVVVVGMRYVGWFDELPLILRFIFLSLVWGLAYLIFLATFGRMQVRHLFESLRAQKIV